MKHFLLFLVIAFAISNTNATDLYWIGNGGDWGDVNHWSQTSGGSPCNCIPTQNDNVYFDANSFGGGGQTVNINLEAYCKSMDWTGAASSSTLAGTSTTHLYGSLVLNPNMNITYQNSFSFQSNNSGNTIQTFGKTIYPYFYGLNGEWTLQDNLTAPYIYFAAGSLNTNNVTVNTGGFYCGGNEVRSLTLGSSTITVSSSGTALEFSGSNLTLNAGTSTIKLTGESVTFNGSNLTYYNVSFSGNINIWNNGTFNNLTLGTSKTTSISSTQTINGNFYCDGTASVHSSINGGTLNKSSGTVCINYVDLTNTIATGGAAFYAGNSLNLGNNTGWLFQSYTSGVPDININPASLTLNQTVLKDRKNIQWQTALPVSEIIDESNFGKGAIIPQNILDYWKSHSPIIKEEHNILTTIDWSSYDSPVKNQYTCGSCWAFAATALVENLGSQNDLSEQVVLSCVTSGNCISGYLVDALDYYHIVGVPDESCYPYINAKGNCDDKCEDPPFLEKLNTVNNTLWGEPTVTMLKNELNNGPLAVYMRVPVGWSYPGGIYNYEGGPISPNQGHFVLLVGYNDTEQSFKAKNSWGASWGEGGYFRIAYDDVTDDVMFGWYASKGSVALLDIIHTPIASMTTSQPISITAFVSASLQIGGGSLAPRLYYRTKQYGGSFGSFIEVVGSTTESGNYTFNVPALLLGTACQYYLAAQDANSSIVKTLPSGGGGFNPPGNIPPTTFYQFFVAPLTVAMYDEANDLTNWTAVGTWNITTAKYVSAPSSFTDSPGGNYLANTTSSLKYNNQVGITNALGAVLEFDTQWDIETDWDYGQIQLSTNNGTTWISLTGQYTNPGTGTFQPNGEPLYDGTQSTWVHETIDITSYTGQQVTIRYYFRSDGSVQQDGWYVDNVKISIYNGIIPATFPLSVSIYDGWNMVSIPGLHPTNQNVNTWWSGRNPLADVYKWTTSYVSVTTATPSEGYWMLHTGANVYNTGDEWPAGGIQIVAHNPITVLQGWNMIGGYDLSVPVGSLTTTPPGRIVAGTIYGWNGSYYNPANLVQGYGYWVLLSANAVINFPTLDAATPKAVVVQDNNEGWGKITLTDASGKSYVLYAVKGEVNLESYQLPPLPPAGMFDVRYGSGRKAEKLDIGIQTIETQGITYPVRVRVEKTGIRIQDETGRIVNERLKSGEEVTISNSLISKLKVSVDVIPDKYALEQNYPNPFNPITKIKYSIPSTSNVKILIYNALGQLVEQCVNEVQEADTYEVEFNASKNASGIYFYSIQAGSFVDTKKMVLIK